MIECASPNKSRKRLEGGTVGLVSTSQDQAESGRTKLVTTLEDYEDGASHSSPLYRQHEKNGNDDGAGTSQDQAALLQLRSRNLFIAKAMFFANSMSQVGWTRFQNNFYLEHGLNSYQIGSLKSVGLVFKFITEPFLCFVADLTDAKIVFALCVVMQILTMEVLRIARPLTFDIMFLVKVLRSTTAPANTLTTTASIKLTEGSGEGYGRQRMFGSLAWGGGAFLSGYLIDHCGMESIFYYTYFFLIANLFCVIFGLPSRMNKSVPHSKSDDFNSVEARRKEEIAMSSKKKASICSYFSDISQFFSYVPCKILLVNVFGVGIAMTVPETFLFISLETDFAASRTFAGLCTAIATISVLPIFWYSDQLIARYGHFRLIAISQGAGVLRLALYSLLPNTVPFALQLILVVQTLHGVNFALYWATMVDAIFKLAPKKLTTSCMATLNVTFFTLSGALGNLIWGIVYDEMGGVHWVYVGASAMMATFLVGFYSTRSLWVASFSKTLSSHSNSEENDSLL
jgi:predicted MFS family arabinose efflux permease